MLRAGDAALQMGVHTDDIANPPTIVNLNAIFTGPATVGSGWFIIMDDNGAGNNVYLVVSDGANWWQQPMTKCV